MTSLFDTSRLGNVHDATDGPIEHVLGQLEGVRRTGHDKWSARCPSHDDKQASLSVSRGDDGRVLLCCHAGCLFESIVGAIGLETKDLFADGSRGKRTRTNGQPETGLTLARLCEAKHLDLRFVRSLGWRDAQRFGRQCVEIPYRKRDGTKGRTRIRTALEGAKRFLFDKGDLPIVAYEPDGGALARSEQCMSIVEGETDATTMLYAGFPAIGLPGAASTKLLEAEHLAGIKRIYISRETDTAGEKFVASVYARTRKLGFTGRVYELPMPDGAKDPNSLWQRDHDAFADKLNVAMANACDLSSADALHMHTPSEPDSNGNVGQKDSYSSLTYFDRGDHVELGVALLDELEVSGKVVYDDGQLYQYTRPSHVYAPVSESAQSCILQGFAGRPAGQKCKPLELKRSDVAGAMKLAWDRAAQPGFFAGAPLGLVFDDAFVEVTSTECVRRAHAETHRARFSYPFAFEPNAVPERWMRFLAEVFAADDELERSQKIRLLQECVGVSMLGLATRFQRALILLGVGANGKSVYMRVVERCMPVGACCAIAPQDWGQEYRLALLAGKRLNLVSELPEADILSSETFKAVVAGDSLTGRHIRQSPFEFRPVAGHIFAANRLPGSTDHTHGFWRRFLIVKFDRVFALSEQDPGLADTLIRAELPAIVSWFLLGAQRVLAQLGYTEPRSSVDAVEVWRRGADQVAAFLEDATDPLPSTAPVSGGVAASDLYTTYRDWAEANGHRALASNKFGERMTARGLGAAHMHDARRHPLRVRPRSEWGRR